MHPHDIMHNRLRQGLIDDGMGAHGSILHHPFRFIADPSDLADPLKLGGIFGVPDSLWVAGVGTVRGPVLNANGAPVAGVSPWQLNDESAVASEVHTGASSRTTTTLVDPAITEDTIAIICFRSSHIPVAGNRIFATRIPGVSDGFSIAYLAIDQLFARMTTAGGNGASLPAAGHLPPSTLGLAIMIYNRVGANITLWTPGSIGATNAVPAGAIVGAGVGIAAAPDDTFNAGAGAAVIFSAIYNAAGRAAVWSAGSFALCDKLLQMFTGTHPSNGDIGTYTGLSAKSWQNRNGVWAIGSPGLPRSGDSGGLRAAPGRTNEATRNINPQPGDAAAALTWTGAKAPTEVDDSVALAAVAKDATAWGPQVYEYANTTGVTQYIRMSAQTGNVNDRSIQCLIRRVAGAGSIKLGLYDESAGTFVGTAVTEGYNERTIINGQTPGDVDLTLCLEVANGVTIRWIAHDMGEGVTCQLPTPNYATGAPAVRAADVLTTNVTLPDEQGSISALITPLGWFAGDVIGTSPRITDGSGQFVIYATSTGWRAFDGTNTVIVGTPTDGVEEDIRTRWGEGGLSLVVTGVRGSDNYDGALTGAGALRIEPDQEVSISDFSVFRSGRG